MNTNIGDEEEMEKHLETPLTEKKVKELHAGDYVYISGTVYTARDAAHKRMIETLEKGESLPFDMQDQIIYYLGPTPNREGQVIGSAGPTTSSRMDRYAPSLLDRGLKGMIGKGKRSEEVIASMKKIQRYILLLSEEPGHFYQNVSLKVK